MSGYLLKWLLVQKNISYLAPFALLRSGRSGPWDVFNQSEMAISAETDDQHRIGIGRNLTGVYRVKEIPYAPDAQSLYPLCKQTARGRPPQSPRLHR